MAGIQNHRQVLILSSDTENLIAKDIQQVLSADAQKQSDLKQKSEKGNDAKP